MAVVISGTNNSDKITATDGLIDLLSSVNFASEVTVPSFKVGSDIQIGNAGIITATTLVGNVTGNINHTSNLLLQISGSEKFRVGTSGQLGIGGANYGSAGQVLTSGGSGSAATWSTIASDKITEGNTEAEVIDTGSDGHFKVTTEGNENFRVTSDRKVGINRTSPTRHLHVYSPGAGFPAKFESAYTYSSVEFADTGTVVVPYIGSKNDHLVAGIGNTERFRIGSAGQIGIAGANYGSSGQFLQSQGSGSAVQWASVASDFVKISSTTMGGEAAQFELDFDTSTYKYFKIYLTGLNLSYDANLYVRFKVSGTIQTNNAYYGGTIKKHAGGFDNNTYGGQHQNYGYLTHNVGGNDGTYERYSAVFDINCGEASRGMPFLRHDSFYKDNLGNHANTMGIVGYQNWSVLNGIRFYASSGNINHGKYDLYGIK